MEEQKKKVKKVKIELDDPEAGTASAWIDRETREIIAQQSYR